MDNNKLIQRFDRVASDRTTAQETWDLIEEYVTPYRGRFFRDQRDEHSIEWRDRSVWDATAIVSHQMLASSLHGTLTSPSVRWFDIRFRNQKLNDNKQASAWLREASEKVYWALQDSNFNLEINETYQDLAGFGTAFMVLEEGEEEQLDFQSVPLKEAYFEADSRGKAKYFYRLLKWTPTQIVDKFGENVPENIREQYEAGNNEEKHDIVFCIYPRHNRTVDMGKRVAPSRRPFGAKYILKNGETTLGNETGYYEMPVFVPRWRITSESQWGNSPAHLAMNDILTLNAWVELLTIASEKKIDPPILVEEFAMITDLLMDARAVSVVRNIEGVRPFETGSDIYVTLEGVSRLQENIRNYFFNNQLSFPDPQAQPMTATEAQIRYEEMQKLLGPTLARIQVDLLDLIVSRSFNILARAGELPEVPAVILEAEDAQMDLEYVGPLARAQRVDNVAAVERWLMTIGQGAQLLGEGSDEAIKMLSVPDGEAISRLVANYLNVDPTMTRDRKEVQAESDARQEARNQALAAQQAQEQGAGMTAVAEGEQAMQAVAQ